MSFFNEVRKIYSYIPVLRTCLDIIFGAIFGIYDVIKDPRQGVRKFEEDSRADKELPKT